MSLGVKEVTVPSRVIDPIEFALPHEEIGLPQRPSLSHCESVKLVSDFDELVVHILEPWVDFAFPVMGQ